MISQDALAEIEHLPLAKALLKLANLFPNKVVFSTSLGQEDQVITHIIASNHIPIQIFTLDTGRLFYETYELLERTNSRYNSNIKTYFPDSKEVESFVNKEGINSFYDSVENRKTCCYIRKVQPLERALEGAKVWVTGLRAEQSTDRSATSKLEWDAVRELYKFNPLIHWTYESLMNYINENDVIYNPLHDQGFVSIGCAPCTRAIQEGEEARDGRWWWESSKKECGLHVNK
jgi:phosphoadenosine phosphosulfate reductase